MRIFFALWCNALRSQQTNASCVFRRFFFTFKLQWLTSRLRCRVKSTSCTQRFQRKILKNWTVVWFKLIRRAKFKVSLHNSYGTLSRNELSTQVCKYYCNPLILTVWYRGLNVAHKILAQQYRQRRKTVHFCFSPSPVVRSKYYPYKK